MSSVPYFFQTQDIQKSSAAFMLNENFGKFLSDTQNYFDASVTPLKLTGIVTQIASKTLGSWTTTSSSFVNIGGETAVNYTVTGSTILIIGIFSYFATVAACDTLAKISFGSSSGTEIHCFKNTLSDHDQRTVIGLFTSVTAGTYATMVQVELESAGGTINTDGNDSLQIYGLQLG